MTHTLAPHEALELREILTSEITSAKKIKSNLNMVKDKELQTYMQDCLNHKMGNIESIQLLINNDLKK